MMGGGGNSMMGYGWNNIGGWGGFGPGWIFMIIFWILIILGVVVLVRNLGDTKQNDAGKTSLDILKERYAKGEINKEEFKAKKMLIISGIGTKQYFYNLGYKKEGMRQAHPIQNGIKKPGYWEHLLEQHMSSHHFLFDTYFQI